MVKRITEKMESVKEDLFTPLNSPDFRTKMSIAHIEGDSDAYMKCVVNVDDKSVAATKITQVSETECKIEMIFEPIPKKRKYRERSFSKPTVIEGSGEAIENISKLADALPTNRDYRTLNRMQMKFQNWRKLEGGLDESDGEVMGVMLTANTSNLLSKNRTKKMKERRVKNFFEEFHAMRTMKIEHPFFETMIQAVIVGENKKEEKGRHSETKLAVLTIYDGNYLGASFLKFLNV
ncbi:hypothetical protein ScalyP_jg4210, partial [Parmales sp. scaly parma]